MTVNRFLTLIYIQTDSESFNYVVLMACVYLRANILVACKVTPAIWLNLSDSRNILIIHFGLLLKERTLDSIGHDLWKKYNVTCLLWMICYISLLTLNKHIYTVDSYWCIVGFLNSPLRHKV